MTPCNDLCTKASTGTCKLCDALAERDKFIRIYLGGFLIESISAFCKTVIAFPWHKVSSEILIRTVESLIKIATLVFVTFNISKNFARIVENPIKIATLVFVVSTITVIALTVIFFKYDETFFRIYS